MVLVIFYDRCDLSRGLKQSVCVDRYLCGRLSYDVNEFRNTHTLTDGRMMSSSCASELLRNPNHNL